jgi:hypothetical protein
MKNGGTGSAAVYALWFCLCVAAGCSTIERAEQERTHARLDEAVARYEMAAAQVRLGDSQEKVLALLQPAQASLLSDDIKGPAAFPIETKTGQRSMVDVFFFRSSWHADEAPTRDGLPPDDNFTPYVFADGVLTGIGWPALHAMGMKQKEEVR